MRGTIDEGKCMRAARDADKTQDYIGDSLSGLILAREANLEHPSSIIQYNRPLKSVCDHSLRGLSLRFLGSRAHR